MDRLGYLESFLAVLDLGSLSAAARRLNLSQPAVSQQMNALETYYGTALLQRSTTGVRPTRAGSVVARHAQDLIDGHRLLQAEVEALATDPRGALKVTMSRFMGDSRVGELVQALCGRYPDLDLRLKVEDRLVDVVREGYDLALRTGTMGETDGIARKVARLETVLVAAPAYLDRTGRPERPSDLCRLSHIQYAEHRSHGCVTLHDASGVEAEASLVNGLVVDTPEHLVRAALNGYGFARMPALMAGAHLRAGRLEALLADYRVEPKPVYLIYPHRHGLDRATRLVIEAIYEGLAGFEATEILPHPDLQPA